MALSKSQTAYNRRKVDELLSVYEALETRKPDPQVDWMEINYMNGVVTTNGSLKPPNKDYGPSLWIWDYSLEWVDYKNLTPEQQRKMKALNTVGEVLDKYGDYVEGHELRYHYPVFCTAAEMNRLLISKIGLMSGPKVCHYLKLTVVCRAVSVSEFKEYALEHMTLEDLEIDTANFAKTYVNSFLKKSIQLDDTFDINYFEFVEEN